MARISRRYLVDLSSSNHCTFRGHNYLELFKESDVADKFLELLAKYKARYRILIHSYCLMHTHPHVLLTALDGQPAFSAFWKAVNQALARYYNRKHRRRGQVVMERLRSPMIQPDGRHMLTVMRYSDLNPVRARLVRSPKDWRYSSYRHYAFGEPNELIDDAPDYLALGRSPSARRKAYVALFAQKLIAHLLERQVHLSRGPFIGEAPWLAEKFAPLGLKPPGPWC